MPEKSLLLVSGRGFSWFALLSRGACWALPASSRYFVIFVVSELALLPAGNAPKNKGHRHLKGKTRYYWHLI